MKHTLYAVALTLAAACTAHENKTPTTPSPATEDAAAAEVPPIPTQEEADAAAAQQINETNADAELEKLKSEIGGEK